MGNKDTLIAVGILVILILIGLAILFTVHMPTTGLYTTIPKSGGIIAVPVIMTDPAQVPAGTQALIVTYSSVYVRSASAYAQGPWIQAAGSGSINLIAVQQSGRLIGYANISSGSDINDAQVNITSASITINGTTYPVTVSGYSQVNSGVTGSPINASSGILLDFVPTVAAVYTNSSTTFVMEPSAKAAVVSNAGVSAGASTGASISLSASDRASLEAAAPNITITSSSLVVSGNSTSLVLTVKDNSNTSVTLENVVLSGAESANLASNTGVNASVGTSINDIIGGLTGSTVSANLSTTAKALLGVGLNIQTFQQVVFAASSRGSLSIPASGASLFDESGYVLTPGSTAQLSFGGTMTEASGTFVLTPTIDSQYRLTVVGQGGASATTTVTAAAT